MVDNATNPEACLDPKTETFIRLAHAMGPQLCDRRRENGAGLLRACAAAELLHLVTYGRTVSPGATFVCTGEGALTVAGIAAMLPLYDAACLKAVLSSGVVDLHRLSSSDISCLSQVLADPTLVTDLLARAPRGTHGLAEVAAALGADSNFVAWVRERLELDSCLSTP